MAHHDRGARRASSIESYLWQTRLLALAALVVLIVGGVFDVVERHFWSRNSLLTDLISGLIVVLVSVAVVTG